MMSFNNDIMTLTSLHTKPSINILLRKLCKNSRQLMEKKNIRMLYRAFVEIKDLAQKSVYPLKLLQTNIQNKYTHIQIQ